jgi:hypothetical protein
MPLAYDHYRDDAANPLEHVEMLAACNDWPLSRTGEDEAHIAITAGDAGLQLTINWREDTESLYVACMFDMRVPAVRASETARLVQQINERLLMGHFDFWRSEGLVLYRNGLLLTGGAQATEAQCESLISLAIQACERHYPAFQFVAWAGKSASEALRACLFETAGEA